MDGREVEELQIAAEVKEPLGAHITASAGGGRVEDDGGPLFQLAPVGVFDQAGRLVAGDEGALPAHPAHIALGEDLNVRRADRDPPYADEHLAGSRHGGGPVLEAHLMEAGLNDRPHLYAARFPLRSASRKGPRRSGFTLR